MFAALLLVASPSILPFAPASPAIFQPVPGAPCVCFPVQHAGERVLPENPLAKSGWTPARLVDETLRVVHTSDDLFVRAEALRTTLRALGQAAEAPDASPLARRALFDRLAADLKRETELAPWSSARIELPRDVEATRTRLSALPGVARVEDSPSKTALIVWFDAAKLSAETLRANVPAGATPSIEAPTQVPRAYAAITLAFAGQSSTQLGHRVDFDPRALAREAADLQPKDPRLLLLAAMVWFDTKAATSAVYVRDALRSSAGDEYVQKNILSIFAHFFDADSIEELLTKLDQRIARG